MSLGLAGAALACMAVVVLGQSQSYSLELSDGTTGRVMVVNESDQPMEAFHFHSECGNGGFEFVEDQLASWGSGSDLTDLSGRHFRSPYLLGPHQRGMSMRRVMPQPSGCAAHSDIDAVVYADGSYEGDESAVQALQARRDGMAAALQFWIERLNGEDLQRLDVGSLGEEAGRLKHTDETKYSCRVAPIACSYWLGRLQVDQNVLLQLKPNDGEDDPATLRRILGLLVRWQKKIGDDAAFKKLDGQFPLPDGIAPKIVVAQQPRGDG